jgi:hypothetical protein
MSSNLENFNIQRRLLNILENGVNMGTEQLERALDGLLGATRQAILRQRNSQTIVQPITTTPVRELTPVLSQVPPVVVRPSVLLRQIIETQTPNIESNTPPRELSPANILSPSDSLQGTVLFRDMISDDEPEEERKSWQDYARSCIKKKSISKTRFDLDCKDDCPICLDNHTNGESIITECEHIFGKQCWQNWICNPNGNQKCPTCRKKCPKIVTYTQRIPKNTSI